MKARIVAMDPQEQLARLTLPSGETIWCKGGYLDSTTYSCHVTIKNIFGIPCKHVWHFGMTTATKNDQNVVHVDFGEHPPFFAMVGYAVQFESVQQMRLVQGQHDRHFDAAKAIQVLLDAGVIRQKQKV